VGRSSRTSAPCFQTARSASPKSTDRKKQIKPKASPCSLKMTHLQTYRHRKSSRLAAAGNFSIQCARSEFVAVTAPSGRAQNDLLDDRRAARGISGGEYQNGRRHGRLNDNQPLAADATRTKSLSFRPSSDRRLTVQTNIVCRCATAVFSNAADGAAAFRRRWDASACRRATNYPARWPAASNRTWPSHVALAGPGFGLLLADEPTGISIPRWRASVLDCRGDACDGATIVM